MGKDLVPRFTCPLCGWLAYWSMLEGGPHKPEIRGMKYGGFQEISYHRVWDFGTKRAYKQFLRLKVRELAKELGLKLVDEVDVDAAEEEEIEVDTEQAEDDLDALSQEIGLGPGATYSPAVRTVPRSAGHAAGGSTGHAAGNVETVSHLMHAMSKIQIQTFSGSRFSKMQELDPNKVVEADFEFVERGESDG